MEASVEQQEVPNLQWVKTKHRLTFPRQHHLDCPDGTYRVSGAACAGHQAHLLHRDAGSEEVPHGAQEQGRWDLPGLSASL